MKNRFFRSIITMNKVAKVLVLALISGGTLAWSAGKLKFVGAGAPIKHNDDSNIGRFIEISPPEKYGHITFNIANKVPGATPWIHWGVGGWPDVEGALQNPRTDDQQEPYLKYLDSLGVQIWLAFRPQSRDAVALAQTYLGKFGKFQNVVGVSVDMEFYNNIGTNAKRIDDAIKAINPKYRLMIKGYMTSMFPTYRGKGDLFFIHTSSEGPIPNLVKAHTDFCNQVGRENPPVACGGQIGYPNDEKNGVHKVTNQTYNGWISLQPDPVSGWAKMMTDAIVNPNQEIGFDWLTVTSSVNPSWDITKGATIPTSISPRRSAHRILRVERDSKGLALRFSDGTAPIRIDAVADAMGRNSHGRGLASGRYFLRVSGQEPASAGITAAK